MKNNLVPAYIAAREAVAKGWDGLEDKTPSRFPSSLEEVSELLLAEPNPDALRAPRALVFVTLPFCAPFVAFTAFIIYATADSDEDRVSRFKQEPHLQVQVAIFSIMLLWLAWNAAVSFNWSTAERYHRAVYSTRLGWMAQVLVTIPWPWALWKIWRFPAASFFQRTGPWASTFGQCRDEDKGFFADHMCRSLTAVIFMSTLSLVAFVALTVFLCSLMTVNCVLSLFRQPKREILEGQEKGEFELLKDDQGGKIKDIMVEKSAHQG